MLSALTVRMFTRCVVVTLAGLLFLAQAHTTEAAPIVFNDRAAFNAAAQPNVFDDFSCAGAVHGRRPVLRPHLLGRDFQFRFAGFPHVPLGCATVNRFHERRADVRRRYETSAL